MLYYVLCACCIAAQLSADALTGQAPDAPVHQKVQRCYDTDVWGRKVVTAKADVILKRAGILEDDLNMCCV